MPYFRWAKLESLAAKKQYLYQLLQVGALPLPTLRSLHSARLLPGHSYLMRCVDRYACL